MTNTTSQTESTFPNESATAATSSVSPVVPPISPAPRKRIHIPEAQLFGAAAALAAAPVAYVVAEKVFPILVEKGVDIITAILKK